MTSKTKIGVLLIGVGAILGTVGSYLTGNIALATTIEALIIEIGSVIAAFGIRDLPIINRTK